MKFKSKFYSIFMIGFALTVTLFGFLNCSKTTSGGGSNNPPLPTVSSTPTPSATPTPTSSATPTPTPSATPNPVWTRLGPYGGFIASIAFHPTRSNEVWISGDDSDGLYKSTDSGATWQLIDTPANHSSYDLTFDPTNANKIYALNYFGRGVLKSVDGGSTWSVSQAGLPTTAGHKRLFRIAINPLHPERIIAGTQDGIYYSNDSAANFAKRTISWGSSFKAVAYSNSGRLFAGATNGVFKYSDNDGATWSDLGAGSSGEGVYDIAVSTNAVYVLFDLGSLVWYQLPNFATGGIINTPTSITNGNVMGISVKSGSAQNTDLIYLGTTKTGSDASKWGLFKSTNGGGSWTQQGSGISGQSIFAVAISPFDSNLVIAGSSASGGVFRTTNGGSSWSAASTGVFGNSALGLAQNPANAQELILSSTVGMGWGLSFHSIDGGTTWNAISEVNPTDGVMSWDISPSNSNVILAGMFLSGVYRSTNGVGGPWQRVINKSIRTGRIYHDKVNTNIVYAVGTDGLHDSNGNLTNSAEVRVYYSTDNGATFAIRSGTFTPALAIHPSHTNEAVSFFTDAYATINGFSTQNSLGLSTQAADQGALVAGAFHPTEEGHLLIGGHKGGVYKTTNYNSNGSGVTWTTLTSPAPNTTIRDLLIRVEQGQTVYYLTSLAADVDFESNAKPGLFRSIDGGSSWVELSTNSRPCSSFLWLIPQVGTSNKFWLGGFGGGLFQLEL